MSLTDAMLRLRGLPGTTVKLTIRRRDRQLHIALPRERISPLSPVRAFLREEHGRKIGYVALPQFTATAGQQMREAIQDLSRKGASGFVLDLRNNPPHIYSRLKAPASAKLIPAAARKFLCAAAIRGLIRLAPRCGKMSFCDEQSLLTSHIGLYSLRVRILLSRVIPAKARIQDFQKLMDARFRGHDDKNNPY